MTIHKESYYYGINDMYQVIISHKGIPAEVKTRTYHMWLRARLDCGYEENYPGEYDQIRE